MLASRFIADPATGAPWTVTEVDTQELPGARGPSCLLFDGPTMVRRVWHYPDNWQALCDTALLTLSWNV